jgi:phage shock protein PspC (stress-responsive transcriptional regulator)
MVRGRVRRDLGPMTDTTPSSPDPDAPTTQQAPAPRRLLRSRDDRVIGGVCGGIARYFAIDPLIVRIAAVALTFVGGAALIAYIAALAFVPEDDGTGHPVPGKPSRPATIVGAVLVVIAGIALMDGNGLHLGWAFGSLAPLAVLALLLAVAGQRVLRSRGEQRPTAGRIVGAGLLLCAALLGSLVLGLGAGWLTASGGGTVVAAIVVALGLAMIALSFKTPRARWLALPAMVLAIPAGVVSAAGIDAEGGVGQRTYHPATVADLRADGYQLGTGQLVVDLRDMRWPTGDPVHLKVHVGIGAALVLVPRDVCVRAAAHVGMGYLNVLGTETGGADVDEQEGNLDRATGPQLILDGETGLGALQVRHTREQGTAPAGHGPDQIDRALADRGCAGERA